MGNTGPEAFSIKSCVMGTALAPWVVWSGGPAVWVRHRGTHQLVEVDPPVGAWEKLWSIFEEGEFWTWSDVAGDSRQKDGWRSLIEVNWRGRTQCVNIRIAGRTPDVLRVDPTMSRLLHWMDDVAGFDPEKWACEEG
jgi:hypothetical protein